MTKKRRPNNDGTYRVRRNAQGRITSHQVAVSYTDLETGHRARRWFSAKTQREAVELARAFREQVAQLGGLPNQERTVALYLRDWLDGRRHDLKPKTVQDYERVVERLLIPALGKVPLAKLTPMDVNRMVTNLVRAGKPGEAQRALNRLKLALSEAQRLMLVSVNAAERVKPPKVSQTEHSIWQPAEIQRFLEFTRDDRLHALYAVLVSTGLRSGEARGLFWTDLDMVGRALNVERQYVEMSRAADHHFALPKRDSRRAIPLSDDLLNILENHRRRQEEERAVAGVVWQHPDLMFTTTVGSPISSTNLLRAFKRHSEQAGVPIIRLHDLRDTAASMMLASGIPLPHVAELLGHRDSSMTLRKYTHAIASERTRYRVGPETSTTVGAAASDRVG